MEHWGCWANDPRRPAGSREDRRSSTSGDPGGDAYAMDRDEPLKARPRVACIAGPPPDLDLLGVPRITHDEVVGRGLCRPAGEQAHREVERAPPGVDGCRAA